MTGLERGPDDEHGGIIAESEGAAELHIGDLRGGLERLGMRPLVIGVLEDEDSALLVAVGCRVEVRACDREVVVKCRR